MYPAGNWIHEVVFSDWGYECCLPYTWPLSLLSVSLHAMHVTLCVDMHRNCMCVHAEK